MPSDGGVDADLGPTGHDARALRQARIERLCPRARNDDDVLVALHARGDGPFHVGRIVDVDVVVHNHDMLESITDSAASSAFLPSPGAFLIEITACQNAQPRPA